MLGAELGCEPSDLESHALSVVAKPKSEKDSSVALVATCGTGTVFSVEPSLVDWVRANAPEPHFRVMQPFFLADVATRAIESGFAGASARGFSLGFVLAEAPPVPVVPGGYRLVELSVGEIVRLRATKEFDNALAEPEETPRVQAFRTAFALLDGGESPAAIAGIWDEGPGVDEIGVDVRRDVRGGGLAKAVVLQATRHVLANGRTPIYTCGTTNVRSHNNAISCGYRPFWTIGRVWAPPTIG
jgi:hypothetical protein